MTKYVCAAQGHNNDGEKREDVEDVGVAACVLAYSRTDGDADKSRSLEGRLQERSRLRRNGSTVNVMFMLTSLIKCFKYCYLRICAIQ